MAEKIAAIYVMVRQDELKPEDNGSYEGPMAKQKDECMKFLNEKLGGKIEEPVEVYTSRKQLLVDVERERIGRVVVYGTDRLGAVREDIEGILFELKMSNIEVLSVTGN